MFLNYNLTHLCFEVILFSFFCFLNMSTAKSLTLLCVSTQAQLPFTSDRKGAFREILLVKGLWVETEKINPSLSPDSKLFH